MVLDGCRSFLLLVTTVTPFGLRPQQQLWEGFSQDHSNEKKVMFHIFF